VLPGGQRASVGGVADAISVCGLVKTFGRTRALDGLDLTVTKGEVHGFLGPNGSGKSTTIRVLLGLIKATAGTARLLDGDPWTQATQLHQRVAYVPGDVTLWPNLTGGEIVDLLGRLRGGLDPKRRARLVEQFELDLSKKARAYSKGNRQKVALVAAFAADAELLILDEPTSGLDPLMETIFQQCVGAAKDRGATVLLSSHILSEVEALGDRVSIIRKGRTVDTGTLSELRHLSRIALDATTTSDVPRLTDIPGVHDLTVDGKRVRCHVDESALAEVVARLARAGLRSVTCQPPTLEELFLRHYGEQPDAAPSSAHASA
jgi:ABC-2 type transport system ATP-binding protein